MNAVPDHHLASQAVAHTRTPQGLTFQTHDGVTLRYRYWPAVSGARSGTIALFHRGHEHGGRMAHLVDELNLPDMAFVAWDARGHGESPGCAFRPRANSRRSGAS